MEELRAGTAGNGTARCPPYDVDSIKGGGYDDIIQIQVARADNRQRVRARGQPVRRPLCVCADSTDGAAGLRRGNRRDRHAQPNGFWEVVSRNDGTRQWAYKGYALYTYAGGKAPGQHTGQATYDFAKLEGTAKDMERAAFLAEVGKAPGGAGIYWNLAKP